MSDLPTIAPELRSQIEARLVRLARDEEVRLLMAVESGSRAWGFPSPDSDYDVRFVYIRPSRGYLALRPARDVIERPIVDEIDLNSWDLRKALGLLLKHNAVLSEWLDSPIRYVVDAPIIDHIRDLASRHFDPRGYAKHYASLGTHSVDRWFDVQGSIPVKRYFYALRPALSVRALRLDPSRRPPMSMQPLMRAAQLDPMTVAQIDELIALKANTNEAGNAVRMAGIERLVLDELARADEVPERPSEPEFLHEAEALLVEAIESQ